MKSETETTVVSNLYFLKKQNNVDLEYSLGHDNEQTMYFVIIFNPILLKPSTKSETICLFEEESAYRKKRTFDGRLPWGKPSGWIYVSCLVGCLLYVVIFTE